jgi:hypothetical protein
MERDHHCKVRVNLGYAALGKHACFLCVTEPFGALLFSIHRTAWNLQKAKLVSPPEHRPGPPRWRDPEATSSAYRSL